MPSILSLVDIRNSWFSDEIPPALSLFCCNLETFRARNNLLAGKIPQELTALISLIIIFQLYGNKLLEIFLQKLYPGSHWPHWNAADRSKSAFWYDPSSTRSFTKPSQIYLSENQFFGEIPPQIGHLSPTSLILSSNLISGKIPSQMNLKLQLLKRAASWIILVSVLLCPHQASWIVRQKPRNPTRFQPKLLTWNNHCPNLPLPWQALQKRCHLRDLHKISVTVN